MGSVGSVGRERSGEREERGSGGPRAAIQVFCSPVLDGRGRDGSEAALPGRDRCPSSRFLHEEGVCGFGIVRVGVANPFEDVDGFSSAASFCDNTLD